MVLAPEKLIPGQQEGEQSPLTPRIEDANQLSRSPEDEERLSELERRQIVPSSQPVVADDNQEVLHPSPNGIPAYSDVSYTPEEQKQARKLTFEDGKRWLIEGWGRFKSMLARKKTPVEIE